jgi:hypothetical protein
MMLVRNYLSKLDIMLISSRVLFRLRIHPALVRQHAKRGSRDMISATLYSYWQYVLAWN